jgi:hypothetical protein
VNFDDRYGRLDRFLHRLAFRVGRAQHALADAEELLFGDTLDSVPLEDPVFVTALPRSGTTILLRLLWQTDRFASHIYRDMPFVLCPVLWNRFAGSFAAEAVERERAHGDGLQVSAESPEALEEMIWKHFWPDHYEDDRILPWRASDRNAEFDRFLERHMRKIVALRRDGAGDERRYLSKNNLDIARLAAPPPALDGGIVLVPFREPVQQAASMLRQHRRFSRIHQEDDFVRRYMEAIGHHEFGETLRPVDFDGWTDTAPSPEKLEFWLRYWIAAYRFVLAHGGPSTRLVSYAALTGSPEEALGRLADAVGLPPSPLTDQSDRVHPPRSHDVEDESVPGHLLDEASSVHDRLRREAVVI